MATFPVQRFQAADATLDELAQLRQEFDNSDLSIQEGFVDLFRSESVGAIRAYLARRRSAGDFGEAPEAPETLLGADYGGADLGGDNDPDNDPEGQDDPDPAASTESDEGATKSKK